MLSSRSDYILLTSVLVVVRQSVERRVQAANETPALESVTGQPKYVQQVETGRSYCLEALSVDGAAAAVFLVRRFLTSHLLLQRRRWRLATAEVEVIVLGRREGDVTAGHEPEGAGDDQGEEAGDEEEG